MSRGSIGLDERTQDWLLRHGVRDDALLEELRAETSRLPNAGMQVSPEQGQFLTLLARLQNARRIVEVGVFTGYSSICLARGLAQGGELLACDVSEEYTAVARRHWLKAGLADRITLALAPAAETLRTRLAQGWAASVDLMFIDADKGNYPVYYELALELLRPGGLVAVDNMLWSGRVADESVQDEDTRAIRELASRIHSDARVEMCLLPIGDGLSLARKR
ncbi:MAG: class I SAM-dependent methyltransferase [Candidatus Delongbacteria bacterium]|nr:class I SAM-dependent methyltransferase [Candidatus Cloacimonadota bacterium]MCB9472627.1 class I SAM-dependent methyltransferase [Candidatus Delongbacteria bacterium]